MTQTLTVAQTPKTRTFKGYFNRKMFSIFLLGFASGLPVALAGSTLQAWYAISNIDVITIGYLSLVGQPYVYKFLWAPIMDRFLPPFLGRRRGWILLAQLGLCLSILLMTFVTPTFNPKLLALLALLVAFFSASQDIAFDAYKIDTLSPDERGLGAAIGVEGWRVGAVLSGGGALFLADHIGFQTTYMAMSLMMLIGILATFITSKELFEVHQPKTLIESFYKPLIEFLTRKKALHILLFIMLYKLGDAFTLSLSTTFLLKEVGFTLSAVGIMNKILATIASLLGIFLGGLLLTRIKLFKALLFFGSLQAISSLAYMLLALVEKNYLLAANAIFIEYLCAGMGTAALVAFLMSLCNHKFSATQYALLTSFAAIGRVYFSAIAGHIVENIGWANFYLSTFFMAIPGILMILWLKAEINAADQK